jgi:hypothetical protein
MPQSETFQDLLVGGCNNVSPVSDLYESPFPFTGEIARGRPAQESR